MTATGTATFDLTHTAQGWTGQLTFALSNAAPDSFIEWCLSQEVVSRAELTAGSTTYIFHLNAHANKQVLEMALVSLVSEASKRLSCEITIAGPSSPLPKRRLSPLEQRVSGVTKAPQLRSLRRPR